MTDQVAEFGRYACDQAGFEHIWVKFKPSGYPFGLRRRWLADRDEISTIETLLTYVLAWNVESMAGVPVPLADAPRLIALVDLVDIVVITWLIQTFAVWMLRDVGRPPKNSSPPSVGTLQPTAELQTN